MSAFRSVRIVPLLGLALFAAACSDTPAAPVTAAGDVSFIIVSGNGQTGAAGEELPQPLEVRAVTTSGQPVPGRHVGFHVTAGRGEMYVGGGVTDANGIVKDYWTLGRLAVDSQRVEARTVDPATGAKQLLGVFTAQSVPGAPVRAVPHNMSPTGYTGRVGLALLDSMRVRLLDRFDNRIYRPGIVVTWTPSADGRVSTRTSQTDFEGVARVRWAFSSTPGLQELSTSVAGTAPQVTFTGTATPKR